MAVIVATIQSLNSFITDAVTQYAFIPFIRASSLCLKLIPNE
jgi:hypothetical protein